MKLSVLTFFLLLGSFAFSQSSKPIIYKADQWYDIKGKGFANAADNPTKEPVEITKDDAQIKVVFGSKVLVYKIISSKRFSDALMHYTVKLKDKTYTLGIGTMPDGTISVNIDGDWMVSDIKA
jgi:hypothetical protein